jgi:hypothetical protein
MSPRWFLGVGVACSWLLSVAVPWTVRAEEVTIEIVDAGTGAALPARLYVQGADGGWHLAHSAASDGTAVPYRKERGPQSVEVHTTLSAHPSIVELPAGESRLSVERGPEYRTLDRTARVPDQAEIRLPLARWVDMASRGWYSGDTHVHRPLDELPNLLLAEDLNVALPLTQWVTRAFEPPGASERSAEVPLGPEPVYVDRTHVIYPLNTEYEIFTVNGQAHALGAVFALGQRAPLTLGVPPVAPVAQEAHAQGALLELDKHNWPWSMALVPVMDVDLYELSNNHVWRTEFAFKTFGEPAADYMQIERDEQGFTEAGWIEYGFQNYYALLDCGFRLRPTAGTASGVHPVPLGFGRVYVECPEGFSYESWMRGLDSGRSFVTTGPMLLVEVDGQPAGSTLAAGAGPHRHRVTGQAFSAGPLERIEIVVNGQVAQRISPDNAAAESENPVDPGAFVSPIDAEVELEGSGWIAVRCYEPRGPGRFRFAHGSPVHIDVEGAPLRPRREEAEYLADRVRAQLERSAAVLPEAALAEYRRALEIYERIAEMAR